MRVAVQARLGFAWELCLHGRKGRLRLCIWLCMWLCRRLQCRRLRFSATLKRRDPNWYAVPPPGCFQERHGLHLCELCADSGRRALHPQGEDSTSRGQPTHSALAPPGCRPAGLCITRPLHVDACRHNDRAAPPPPPPPHTHHCRSWQTRAARTSRSSARLSRRCAGAWTQSHAPALWPPRASCPRTAAAQSLPPS